MQVAVESISNLERRMTIEVPAERIDAEVESRLRSLCGRAQIKGFRPGKVPFKVVRQHYGQGVHKEVLGEVLQRSFQEAVSQEKLKPAGMPDVELIDSGPGVRLVYKATFEVYPEVELADLTELEISVPEADITDADIDRMIETLRNQRKTWKQVDQAAGEGDQVVVDFEGFLGDEAFEGGKASDMQVVIGEGRMIPGFEEQLKGVREGDAKTLEVTFPENYQVAELAGKAARFETKVKAVSTAELPPVDEDFARAFGVADGSVATLRDDIRQNMQREMQQAVKARVKAQVMKALVEKHQLEVPGVLVSSEIQHLRRQALASIGQKGDAVLPDEMFADEAKKRVVLGLVVGKIIDEHKIELDPDQVEKTLSEIAAGYDDAEQVKEYYRGDKERLASLEAMVLEGQVVDWLKSRARVTPEKTSFDALMNPDKGKE